MRVFPRIHIPKRRALGRAAAGVRRRATPARLVLAAEGLVLGASLVAILGVRRPALMDSLDGRADAVAVAALIVAFAVFHARVGREVAAALARRGAPTPYDERGVLLDLGSEARRAWSVDELYKLIIERVGAALEASPVCLFVRDDTSGDYECRSSTGQLAARLALGGDAFVVRRLRFLAGPLPVGSDDFNAWERALEADGTESRSARRREVETLRRAGAVLLVQVKIRDQLVGVLSLGPRRSGGGYSGADREMLTLVAGQLAFAIENGKMLERIAAEEQLRREVALATEVQQRLFPAEPPRVQGLELSGFCQPARGVGGDYYDFLRLDGGRAGVAVADVSGKGFGAALLMANVQALLRGQALALRDGGADGADPSALATVMNRLLCSSTGPASYVTFFYARCDPAARELTYVNAGHNPPLLMRPGGAAGAGECDCVELTAGGAVLGMFEALPYAQETVPFGPGDVLLAFTDGVSEALSPSGEEFGEARLREALASAGGLAADGIRDALVARVREWCAGTPQHDDLTFVVVKAV